MLHAAADGEQLTLNLPLAGFTPTSLARANALLTEWEHYLGPVNRPFGAQSWVLDIDGQSIAVAVSTSTVSETAGGLPRGELVELARLCSAPDSRWATRPMLRLWREVAGPRWPYWAVTAAVAYSQNSRHQGDLYRWDGWAKVADNCGSSGGGAWSRKRYASDSVYGRKTLWLWRYTTQEGIF